MGGVKAVVGLGHGNQRGGRKRDAAPTHVIKKQILGNLGRGMTIVAACAAVDRSRSSFDYYVRNDKEFAAAVDRIRNPSPLHEALYVQNNIWSDLWIARFDRSVTGPRRVELQIGGGFGNGTCTWELG